MLLLLVGVLGIAVGFVGVTLWRSFGRLPTGSVVTISLRPEKGASDGDTAQGLLVSRWGPWVRLERAAWLQANRQPVAVDGTLLVPRSRVLCVQIDPALQGDRA